MKPHPSRTPSRLSESIFHQLNMYAFAANAAGVGILALAQPAEARIVYTSKHVQLQPVTPYPIDLDHNGKVDFVLLESGGFGSNSVLGSLMVCHFSNPSGVPCRSSTFATNTLNQVRVILGGSAADLRTGAKIGNGLRFGGEGGSGRVLMGGFSFKISTTGTQWRGPWVDAGKGVKNRYLGLKFKIDGKFHFGWARLTVTTQKRDCTATLTGYAYETIPNRPIIAGKTKGPDVVTVHPASLGRLATGASAIPTWRMK